MNALAFRNISDELMDDPNISPVELRPVLAGLRRLNKISGTAKDLLCLTRPMCPARDAPYRLLDLGSGGGDVVCDLVSRLLASGVRIEAVGTDLSAYSVEYANNNARARNLPIKFVKQDALEALMSRDYDIVTSSLFLHHLSTEKVLEVFRLIRAKAQVGAVLIDLERSRLNLSLVNFATRLISRSAVIRSDGSQSVRAAFNFEELKVLGRNLPGSELRRLFPCRIGFVWKRSYSGFLTLG